MTYKDTEVCLYLLVHVVAHITPCDELGNIPGQPWPPVVPQHQFQCLPLSRVSCNCSCMVHMHQVMTGLGVVQDINPTSIQDNTFCVCPLIRVEFPCI